MRSLYPSLIKPLLDFIGAALLTLLLSPLLIGIACVIKLESAGPIFYRGVRTGRGGKAFRIFKFRTMVVDAEQIGGPTTGLDDPRVTRTGRFLRHVKLDEIPQLLNILRGDMSFVGPRPEVQRYTDLFVGEEKSILSVRPGITDYSSIKFANLDELVGAENVDQNFETKILPEKNRLRIKYVKEISFLTDAKIVIETARKVLKKFICNI